MKQKPAGRQSSSERAINDIKRKTRKQYSAEEKIRIVQERIASREEVLQTLTGYMHSGEPNEPPLLTNRKLLRQ